MHFFVLVPKVVLQIVAMPVPDRPWPAFGTLPLAVDLVHANVVPVVVSVSSVVVPLFRVPVKLPAGEMLHVAATGPPWSEGERRGGAADEEDPA